jgi:hypothetical protein
MFCGFGSVILLVMIVNADTLTRRKQVHQDLRGEVSRLETEVVAGEQYLAELRNVLDEIERQRVKTEGRSREVLDRIRQIQPEIATFTKETQSQREHVNQLKSDVNKLDQDRQKLAAEQEREKAKGSKVRRYVGEGDRQYLTGLKMGGKRILILVDSSASMLEETIVNIIRLRNLRDAVKRDAPKWQRAVRTVEWLLAQLPVESRYQLFAFNTSARPVIAGTDGKWLDTGDAGTLDQAVARLRAVVPDGGTSLYHAFDVAATLTPRPDNIFLISDGLPTQGKSKSRRSRVSGEQRRKLFRRAIDRLPANVPVNTILFPIEGDPFAASEFWRLALSTTGSFLAPSRDWP